MGAGAILGGLACVILLFALVRTLKYTAKHYLLRKKDVRRGVPKGRHQRQRTTELYEEVVASEEVIQEKMDRNTVEATTIDGEKQSYEEKVAAFQQSQQRLNGDKLPYNSEYRNLEVSDQIYGGNIDVAMDVSMQAMETALTIRKQMKGGVRKVGKTGTKVLQRLIAKSTAKTAQKKVMKKVGSKLLTKLMSKMVVKMAVGSMKAGARLVGKLIFAASSGPIGIAAMVLELVLLAVDVLDFGGYNNFTSNKILYNLRAAQEVMLRNYAQENGLQYPLMLGPEYVFPKQTSEAEHIVTAGLQQVTFDVMIEDYMEANPDAVERMYQEAFDIMKASGDTSEESVEAAFDYLAYEFVDKNFAPTEDEILEVMYTQVVTPKERDQLIFDELQKHLGAAQRKYVMLCPWRSTRDESGLSLTHKGAQWWNRRHKSAWYKYFDLFFPKFDPGEYKGEMAVAVHSDTYLIRNVADPGSEAEPNMEQKKLPGKMTFVLYMPEVVAFCEEPRGLGVMGTNYRFNNGVKPKDLGVRFDETLGMCKVTRKYCTHFGLEHDISAHFGAGDCFSTTGAEVAEMIFGKTITRGFVKVVKFYENNFGVQPKCKEGTKYRVFGVNGNRPGCYEEDPCPDGTYPIESLNGQYTCKYDRGVGTLPPPSLKEPCPPFTTDTGTDCWDSGGRGGGFSEVVGFFEGKNHYEKCKNHSDSRNVVDYDNSLRKANPNGEECKYIPHNPEGLIATGHNKKCTPYRPGTGGRPKGKCFKEPHDQDRIMFMRAYEELEEPVLADDGKTLVCLKAYHCERWRKWFGHTVYPPCPSTLPVDIGANICGKEPGKIGISANVFDRAKCHDDKEKFLGLCYSKPKPGFSCNLTYCSSGDRIGKYVGPPDVCEEGFKLVGSTCKPSS